jgi:hypothetical protein
MYLLYSIILDFVETGSLKNYEIWPQDHKAGLHRLSYRYAFLLGTSNVRTQKSYVDIHSLVTWVNDKQ